MSKSACECSPACHPHHQVAGPGMKEEMVLKIAILGERFAPSPQWYMDTILNLIKLVRIHRRRTSYLGMDFS